MLPGANGGVTVQEDSEPDEFEGRLLERTFSSGRPDGQVDSEFFVASSSVRAMALEVLAEWRLVGDLGHFETGNLREHLQTTHRSRGSPVNPDPEFPERKPYATLCWRPAHGMTQAAACLACRISSTSTEIFTSLPTRTPPVSSAWFQVSPKSVRSIFPRGPLLNPG